MPIDTQNIPALLDGDVKRCPVCKMPVRVIRRPSGQADHYEPIDEYTVLDKYLPPVSPELDEWLQKERAGKRTVAMVGLAATSCSLAPYHRKNIEVWGINESHAFTWMTRATRWFQIHAEKYYTRQVAKRGIIGHYNWLRANEWDIPIYMQFHRPEIPKSIGYPLHEVCQLAFGNITVGDKHPKQFYSSLDYMMGIALLEGRRGIKGEKRFQRIEIYGFEMSHDSEYVDQKGSASFWIGMAAAMGVEVWAPESCQILRNNLYGGNEQGEGW